jgi:DNA-binding GntR family transcriptional regulator
VAASCQVIDRTVKNRLTESHVSAGDRPRVRPELLRPVLRFHTAIARAARIPVLAGMYESIVTLVRGTLVRAEFCDDSAAKVIDENIRVHARSARAIRERDQPALAAALIDHRADLVRLPDSSRSPGRVRPSPHLDPEAP